MVDISGKGHHDGGGDALLEQTAELALGVHLGTESRHAEIVLGTHRGDTLPGGTAHHGGAGVGKGQGQVAAGLDLLGDAAPVGGVDDALGLQLGGGNPVVGLVTQRVGGGGLGAGGEAGALPDSLKAEGELGGDGLEVAADEDAGEATIKRGGVHGLDGGSEVVTDVFRLELEHVLAGAGDDGELGLGDELVGPSPVEARGELAIVVDVSLQEDLGGLLALLIRQDSFPPMTPRWVGWGCWRRRAHLVGSVEAGKGIGVQALAHGESMGDLEKGRQAEGLRDVGAQAAEHVVVDEGIAGDLLGQVLDGSGVRQTELGSPLGEGVVGIGDGRCDRVCCQEGME